MATSTKMTLTVATLPVADFGVRYFMGLFGMAAENERREPLTKPETTSGSGIAASSKWARGESRPRLKQSALSPHAPWHCACMAAEGDRRKTLANSETSSGSDTAASSNWANAESRPCLKKSALSPSRPWHSARGPARARPAPVRIRRPQTLFEIEASLRAPTSVAGKGCGTPAVKTVRRAPGRAPFDYTAGSQKRWTFKRTPSSAAAGSKAASTARKSS